MRARVLLLRCHVAPISGSAVPMSRHDPTDFEWRAIKSLLPNKPRGVPCVDGGRQEHDGQAADHLLDHDGPGTIVLADKAYDTDRIRVFLRVKISRHLRTVIDAYRARDPFYEEGGDHDALGDEFAAL